MMKLSYADMTDIDVSQDLNAKTCMRYVLPFYLIEKRDGFAVLQGLFDGDLWSKGEYKGSILETGFQRKVSMLGFESRYGQIHHNDKPLKNVYGLKVAVSMALQMRCDFGVHTLDEREIVHAVGKAGDYLVQSAIGQKIIVTQKSFEVLYQTGGCEHPAIQDLDLLRASIKKVPTTVRTLDSSIPFTR